MLIMETAMKNVVSFKSQEQIERERRCLHCRMLQVIEDFFAEFPTTTDMPNAPVDTDEVVADAYGVLDAIARLVADMTCCQSIADPQQIIRYLNRRIKFYGGESRKRDDEPERDSRLLN
jgi:hypothetical protein